MLLFFGALGYLVCFLGGRGGEGGGGRGRGEAEGKMTGGSGVGERMRGCVMAKPADPKSRFLCTI